MRILAIDPGGTTGWVYHAAGMIQMYGQHDDWCEFCTHMENMLDNGHVDQIVIETYQITMETVKKTRQYEPLMIIGVTLWLAQKYDVGVKVQARSIKTFATDGKLRNLGWWFEGQQHARDAARHLLAFLWDNKMIEAEEFLDGEG
jgi:hypothetical protein